MIAKISARKMVLLGRLVILLNVAVSIGDRFILLLPSRIFLTLPESGRELLRVFMGAFKFLALMAETVKTTWNNLISIASVLASIIFTYEGSCLSE